MARRKAKKTKAGGKKLTMFLFVFNGDEKQLGAALSDALTKTAKDLGITADVISAAAASTGVSAPPDWAKKARRGFYGSN